MEHFEGVYPAAKKDGTAYFRSSITYHGKHISLGSYLDPQKANQAYLEARFLLLSDRIISNESSTPITNSDSNIKTDISLENWNPSHALSFEKWLILLNLRDNNMYFSTPIYVRKRYFEYFFSPSFSLKFDMDDLFYYASHKIMKRGNHFFVADFGMQVNISDRYGIKNYAVIGKDYRFVNGDTTDFRRENLQILNQYHGVHPYQKKDTVFYRALIHIRGNYLIGQYATSLEAAIAYNKAIDILHSHGCNKNFQANYIEGLSPSQYADVYQKIAISAKIMNYFAE